MRIFLFVLFWFVYFPVIWLMTVFFFWNSKMRDRIRFEKKNKFEALAHSFAEKNITADLCFEFSSEGEYQQVAPLIEDALKAHKKIELVFFSPSVEKAIMKLAGQNPSQIRYLRYPFVRLFPFMRRRCFSEWVTSKTLVMVRYDFFPEFLLWSSKIDHQLKIVWMTFKKERIKGKSVGFWKKLFLNNAKTVVFAGQDDLKVATQFGKSGEAYDFRIEQIKRRMESRLDKFRSSFSIYPEFRNHVKASERSLILGNAWPSDLFLLRDLPRDINLVIVPHKLTPEIIELFRKGLDALGREVFEISDFTSSFVPSATILVNKKGILCELYSDFTHSYVGGGFEGSIHSVLEPLIASEGLIACGPFHHRSTEFDIAKEWDRISEMNTPEQFLEWISLEAKPHAKMMGKAPDYESVRKLVISC